MMTAHNWVQTSTPRVWWLTVSHHVHGCRCGGLNWGRVSGPGWFEQPGGTGSHPSLSHHVPAVGVVVWTEVGCEPSVQMSTPVVWRWWTEVRVWAVSHHVPAVGVEVWTEVTPYLSSNLHTYSRDMMTELTPYLSSSTPVPGRCGGLNWGSTSGLNWGRDMWAVSHHVPAVGVEVWTEVGCQSPTSVMNMSVRSTPRCGGLNWGTPYLSSNLPPTAGTWWLRLRVYLSSNLHTYRWDMMTEVTPWPQFKPPHLQPGVMTDCSHPTSVIMSRL